MKISRKTIGTLLGLGVLCLLLNTCSLNDLGQRAQDLTTPYRTWSYRIDKASPIQNDDMIFGNSVDVSGNYMIVGAPGYNGSKGRAYILNWDGSSWNVANTLDGGAGPGTASEQFGYSVAITSNYAIVGAPGYSSNQGEVYFFKLSGNTWSADGNVIKGAAGSNFGYAVDIDGSYCIIGAYTEQTVGRAYISERNGGLWGIIGTSLSPSSNSGNDYFGISVAISGNIAVVGASHSIVSTKTGAGLAYVFTRTNVGSVQWGTSSSNENAILNPMTPITGANFGLAVDVSGNTIIIGAPYNAGSVSFFTGSNSTWNRIATLTPSNTQAIDNFGYSVSISGNYALVGAYNDSDVVANSGSAYFFEYKGGVWQQAPNNSKVLAPDGISGDMFGFTVNLTSQYAIIGSPLRQNGIYTVGKVYLFQ